MKSVSNLSTRSNRVPNCFSTESPTATDARRHGRVTDHPVRLHKHRPGRSAVREISLCDPESFLFYLSLPPHHRVAVTPVASIIGFFFFLLLRPATTVVYVTMYVFTSQLPGTPIPIDTHLKTLYRICIYV